MAVVCLDASLLIAALLPENHSGRAQRALNTWSRRGDELISSPMMTFEAPSSIRRAVYRARISSESGLAAFEAFLNVPILIKQPPDLLREAWAIGEGLNAPRLYDMYYLALAAIEDCELWTVDERLYNLAARQYPFVRWIGDSLP